jgi:alkylhydroperoxidase family enzyme
LPRSASATRSATSFGALLHSPVLATRISELGRFYRSGSPVFTPGDREWVVEVVGHETNCRREIYSHLAEAVDHGVRPAALAARRGGDDDRLTPAELELTEYVRGIVRGRVTTESYSAIERRYGIRGTVELTAFAAHILMAARLMQALGADHVDDATIDAELQRLLAAGS